MYLDTCRHFFPGNTKDTSEIHAVHMLQHKKNIMAPITAYSNVKQLHFRGCKVSAVD